MNSSPERQELIQTLATTAAAAQATAIACQSLLEQIQAESAEGWVSAAIAAEALGGALSADSLCTRAREGWFKYGREYVDTSTGRRPHYGFKVSALRSWLETKPERRSPPKKKS
jgi:hypothetical protein